MALLRTSSQISLCFTLPPYPKSTYTLSLPTSTEAASKVSSTVILASFADSTVSDLWPNCFGANLEHSFQDPIEPIPSGNLPPGFYPVEGCKLIRKEKKKKRNPIPKPKPGPRCSKIIMSSVSESNVFSQASRGTKRKWVPEEDAALVSYMVDLHNVGTFNADTGFKADYLNELEKMLEKALPNAMLKARPNIESRIRLLKRDWSIMYDMFNGQNTSGFGWDEHRQLVVAEDAVWDSYLKDVPTADINEERNEYYDCDANVSLDDMDVSATEPQPDRNQGGSSSSKKKRKNSDTSDHVSSSSVHDAASLLAENMQTIGEQISRSIASDVVVQQKSEEFQIIQEKVTNLYPTLREIEGLTEDERFRALSKILDHPTQMLVFFSLPSNVRLKWIIMSSVSESNVFSQASRGTKRKWVPEEDAALVSYMVDLHNVGTFNADTGFKADYLNELEKMLEKALPNAMLKARPNIESRIRLLKRDWSIMYDMFNGQNTSGFGWDEHRQLVVAEDARKPKQHTTFSPSRHTSALYHRPLRMYVSHVHLQSAESAQQMEKQMQRTSKRKRKA
ncbi:hypothetical protein GOBAR_DD10236 [Gossypium barbadense]|nr:hypothetical protein GOBAR_DD10236 [Gossypium barbadense]